MQGEYHLSSWVNLGGALSTHIFHREVETPLQIAPNQLQQRLVPRGPQRDLHNVRHLFPISSPYVTYKLTPRSTIISTHGRHRWIYSED